MKQFFFSSSSSSSSSVGERVTQCVCVCLYLYVHSFRINRWFDADNLILNLVNGQCNISKTNFLHWENAKNTPIIGHKNRYNRKSFGRLLDTQKYPMQCYLQHLARCILPARILLVQFQCYIYIVRTESKQWPLHMTLSIRFIHSF